jgi:hypothetical protein
MELFSEANTFLDSADRYETVLVSRGGLFGRSSKGARAQRVRGTGAVGRVGFRTDDDLHCLHPEAHLGEGWHCPIGMPRRLNTRMRALIVHGGIDVPISVDAERIRIWTGEAMGDRSTEGRHCCLLPRRLRRVFVRKRRTAVLIRRIVFVVGAGLYCEIRTSHSMNRSGVSSLRAWRHQ